MAIIYKSQLKVTKVTVHHNPSFESITAKLKLKDNSLIVCSCVYRPDGNISSFLADFDNFLGDILYKLIEFYYVVISIFT